jgi:hypothetical protein
MVLFEEVSSDEEYHKKDAGFVLMVLLVADPSIGQDEVF